MVVVWFRKRESVAFGAYAEAVACCFVRVIFPSPFADRKISEKKETILQGSAIVNVVKIITICLPRLRCLFAWRSQNVVWFSVAIFGAKLRRPENVHYSVK